MVVEEEKEVAEKVETPENTSHTDLTSQRHHQLSLSRDGNAYLTVYLLLDKLSSVLNTNVSN